MKKPLKKAFDAAKNSKIGKTISDNKGVVAGAVVNAGAAAYAWRKAGGKAGLIAGAGSLAWSGISYAYFKALEAQEKQERGETGEATTPAEAPKTEPVADPFAAARRKRKSKKDGDGPKPE